MIMAVLLVAVVVMHFALPQVTDAGVQQVSKLTDRLLEGIAGESGTVDLATGTYLQGSSSKVNVAGATAMLAPDSAAMVHNDPKADHHEILVKKGSGDVVRNGETVHLADFEKVSFQAESGRMEKAKEMGPPTPISPANMMHIFTGDAGTAVDSSCTQMAKAAGYR